MRKFFLLLYRCWNGNVNIFCDKMKEHNLKQVVMTLVFMKTAFFMIRYRYCNGNAIFFLSYFDIFIDYIDSYSKLFSKKQKKHTVTFVICRYITVTQLFLLLNLFFCFKMKIHSNFNKMNKNFQKWTHHHSSRYDFLKNKI